MKFYLIAYTLTGPQERYQFFYNTLQTMSNGHCQAMDNIWVIGHTGPASTIRDMLQRQVDVNDSVLVLGLDRDWATANVMAGQWLQASLGAQK